MNHFVFNKLASLLASIYVCKENLSGHFRTFSKQTNMALLTYTTIILTLCSFGCTAPRFKQKMIDLGYPLDNNTAWWPNMTKYQAIETTTLKNENGIPW